MNALELMTRWSLTPAEMRGLMCFLPTGGATNEALHKAFSKGANTDPHVVSVRIMRLRRKLDRHHIEILTRRGVGYEFAPGGLEKLSAALGRNDQQQVVGA